MIIQNDIQSALSTFFDNELFEKRETVQSLWSGYGEIARYTTIPNSDNTSNSTHNETRRTCVAKIVNPSHKDAHPRGWDSDDSHSRKLSSYINEQNFYEYFSGFTNENCKVPNLISQGRGDESIWMLLQDLNEVGFSHRSSKADIPLVTLGIKWLANFHGCFLHDAQPNLHECASTTSLNIIINEDVVSGSHSWQQHRSKLWPVGTYWHFATRKHEFDSMPVSNLRQCAASIDNVLNSARFQTIVHGDAKLANFCINSCASEVAAVDFQYVGFGSGIKDVVYFLGSCLGEDALYANSQTLLDVYFATLQKALGTAENTSNGEIRHFSFAQVEQEYRYLYTFAWADFERFLSGWSPQHIKRNTYSHEQTCKALAALDVKI